MTCEAAIDECATNLCDPTGTAKCLDLDNKFECECREGFTGELCQVNEDDCATSPCLNGGSCRDEVSFILKYIFLFYYFEIFNVYFYFYSCRLVDTLVLVHLDGLERNVKWILDSVTAIPARTMLSA